MEERKNILSKYLAFFWLVFLVTLSVNKALGQSSSLDSIDATVKTSVCGNEIVEGGEDCDGINLDNATCLSLGYAGGDLKCNIDCSFNTLGCVGEGTVVTPTSISSSVFLPTPIPANSLLDRLFRSASPVVLPRVLAPFDINGSGKIETTEVYTVIKSWVDDWKSNLMEAELKVSKTSRKVTEKKCDVNDDGNCDLIDFSILLFYVGR